MSRDQRWEYHVEAEVSDERLAGLGATGWELVTVTVDPVTARSRAYFKREAADLRERVTLDHRRRFEAAAGGEEA